MSNRRKNTNTVPVARLRWPVVIFIFMAVSGLGFVHLRNQKNVTGDEIKKIEGQLAATKTENEVLRSKIAQLSSHTALQRRFNEGVIALVPITNNSIVRLGKTPAGGGLAEIRAVSNREMIP